MPAAKKPTLRSLAIAAGLLKISDGNAFQMQADELIALLKPKFPGIADLDEDGVNELKVQVEKGGKTAEPEPAGRGRGRAAAEPEPAPRGRGRAAEPEPKVEEPARGRGRRAAEPEPEPVKDEPAPRGRGRGRAEPEPEPAKDEPAPSRRGRGRAAEPEAAEPSGSGSVDRSAKDEVTPLLEEVLKQLGALDKRISDLNVSVEAAVGNVGNLAEIVEGMQEQLQATYDGVECVVFGDAPEKKEQSLAEVIKRVKG